MAQIIFNNGDSAQLIRQGINSNFTENYEAIEALEGSVSTNTSDILTNAGNISTNSGNISTNTTNIGTNTSNIAGLTTRVSDLEDAPSFDYTTIGTISDIGETYTQIISLPGETITEDGVFVNDINITYTYSSITTAVYFRVSTDGTTWTEYIQEPSDIEDIVTFHYSSTVSVSSGSSTTLLVEARKESAIGIFDIVGATASTEKKINPRFVQQLTSAV